MMDLELKSEEIKKIEAAQNRFAVVIHRAAQQLFQNMDRKTGKFNISGCRCSNYTARTLVDAHDGIYGPDYQGCLTDNDALQRFIDGQIESKDWRQIVNK